jgi:hypothetical protein
MKEKEIAEALKKLKLKTKNTVKLSHYSKDDIIIKSKRNEATKNVKA